MISGFPFREKGAETERALPLQFTGNNDTKRWVRFVRGEMALFGVKLFFFFFGTFLINSFKTHTGDFLK